MDELEVTFTAELFKKYNKVKKVLIPRNKYYEIIEQVKAALANDKTKRHEDYYLINKYEILQCGDVQKLIIKRKNSEESPLYFATIEETYDIIRRAHIATG